MKYLETTYLHYICFDKSTENATVGLNFFGNYAPVKESEIWFA
jgi:hypothetical protein